MWNYSEKVMDHFLNPRNAGEIENADGIGEVGNIVCGDAMKLFVRLSPDGKTIAEAKFQTFGCASAIASASALTEMLRGKTLDEAAKLTNQDIADYLGELPEEKMHCSVMGMEAFQAAMRDLKTKHPTIQIEGLDMEEEGESRVVCKCFSVTERKIREVIRANNLKTLEQVTHYCKAGGGCGECKKEIQAILDSELGRLAADQKSDEVAAKPLTNLQRIKLIESTIDDVIRPGLKADGGDVELVDIDGNQVTVKLVGKCAFCPSAMQTLKHWVEAKLREKVSPAIVVNEAK